MNVEYVHHRQPTLTCGHCKQMRNLTKIHRNAIERRRRCQQRGIECLIFLQNIKRFTRPVDTHLANS